MGLFEDIKSQVFLDTAEGGYLTAVGRNEGVERPLYSTSDATYRALVPLLGESPKTTIQVIEALVDVFFGSGSGVEVYQVVPNTIHVRIPRSVFPTSDLASATYLQRQSSVIPTTLTADANKGDTVLTVASTVGFVSGVVHVGVDDTQDPLRLDPTTPVTGATQLNLATGVRVTRFQLANTPVKQIKVEPASVSYVGDYFGVARREATLAAGVSPGGTTATLDPGHTLPSSGFLYFEETLPARRERFLCTVSGTTVQLTQFPEMVPAVTQQFGFAHALGSSVRWFDKAASSLEPSSLANGGNPVILTADSRVSDFLDALDIVRASGIEVQVEEK